MREDGEGSEGAGGRHGQEAATSVAPVEGSYGAGCRGQSSGAQGVRIEILPLAGGGARKIRIDVASRPADWLCPLGHQAHERGLVLEDLGEAAHERVEEDVVVHIVVGGRDLAQDALVGLGVELVPDAR